MELVIPSVQFKDSFIEGIRELQSGLATGATRNYGELSTSDLEVNFEAFVEKERSHSDGKNLPADFVPQTDFWLVDGGEYIGHVGIRHYLNDHLLKIGGHIGYSIRPGKRGNGYGTKILELALPKAKELGLNRILLTCDVTNIASRKIIERNGGVLENQIPNPETGIDKLRFWIEIS